jgi:hypothetical protein
MPRFLSWLSIGAAGALLVVATAAFSLPTITWLAFAVGIPALAIVGLSAHTRVRFSNGAVSRRTRTRT